MVHVDNKKSGHLNLFARVVLPAVPSNQEVVELRSQIKAYYKNSDTELRTFGVHRESCIENNLPAQKRFLSMCFSTSGEDLNNVTAHVTQILVETGGEEETIQISSFSNPFDRSTRANLAVAGPTEVVTSGPEWLR